jgi:hypothetical protein
MIPIEAGVGGSMSDVVLERIAGWESAGLIDAATAERLRAAEAAAVDAEPDPTAASARPGVASSFFGPAVSIVEAFSYLGAAFVLAAWAMLIGRLSSEASGTTRDWLLVAGAAIPAAIFFLIGITLNGRSPRLGRAAGVAFVVSVALIWLGVTLNLDIFYDSSVAAVVGAVAGLAAAVVYRWIHPAILTEIALLATFTGLVQAGLLFLHDVVSPTQQIPDGGTFNNPTLGEVAFASVAWLGTAVVIGLIALAESRGAGAEAARRASLARFWAGIVAIGGVASVLTQTVYDANGFGNRVVEPWIADVIILLISGVLLERAFRRGAGAYVLAAAFGVVLAFTDFNFSYFAQASGTELALLVEGLLLIAIAFGAERLSRRVGGSRPDDGPDASEPLPSDAPQEMAMEPEAVAEAASDGV